MGNSQRKQYRHPLTVIHDEKKAAYDESVAGAKKALAIKYGVKLEAVDRMCYSEMNYKDLIKALKNYPNIEIPPHLRAWIAHAFEPSELYEWVKEYKAIRIGLGFDKIDPVDDAFLDGQPEEVEGSTTTTNTTN